MQTYSVHSIHCRAAKMEGDGYRVYEEAPLIKLGEPLKSFDDLDEAESWRLHQLELWNAERADSH